MRAMVSDAGLALSKFSAIQVAGTNGKGSTATIISFILSAAGMKTGLYTSPHLLDVRERIQAGGKMISTEAFGRLADWARPFAEKHKASYFEALTLMALRYFLDEKMDVAVLEVGLGGRLDATSIVIPNVAVITNISLEHTDALGPTVEKIAREKAAIIPENGIAVTAATGAALFVVKQTAEAQKARLISAKPLEVLQDNPLTVAFAERPVAMGLQGAFQAQNAALAVASARAFNPDIPNEAIVTGLENAFIAGRLQRVGDAIVDGAHNPAGIQALVEALAAGYPGKRWYLFFGVLSDKNYPTMVRCIAQLPLASVTCLTPDSPRALPAEKLVPLFQKAGVDARTGTLLQAKGNKDALCCGSLYVAAEALQILAPGASLCGPYRRQANAIGSGSGK